MKHRILAAVLLALGLATAAFPFDTTKTPVAPDGTKAVIDLPPDQHMTNVGGSDGAGLCVPTSITVAAKWQGLFDLYQYRKFTESRPGGSYPEKTDADLKTYANRYKVTLPPYVQHTGGDETFLELCFATRRMPGMTYAGLDGFYDSGVAHMVNGAHLDGSRGAIIDNNRAGSWVWMKRQQLVNRWKGLDDQGKAILVPVGLARWAPVGGGWCFAWLGPPPPPVPPSAKEQTEGPASSTAKGPGYVWERVSASYLEQPYWALYKDGELIWVVTPDGKWHKATGPGAYELDPSDPPEGLPSPTEAEPTADWNHGVSWDSVPKCSRYWINGIECSRAKAFAAASDPGEGGLVDDTDRYHLSVVLPGRPPVVVPDQYKRRLHIQVYDPSDWPAKDRLKAVVTLQEPAKLGGRIVASSAKTEDIPKMLSDLFDTPPPIKPDPKPDPKPVDPVPPGPVPPPPPATPTLPRWLQLLLAALLGWLGVKYAVRK